MKQFRSPQRPKKNTLVIGRQPVITALKEGQGLDRIYLDGKAVGEEINEIRRLAARQGVPVNYVPVVKLNGFNAGDHQGCIAQLAKITYQDLQSVIDQVVSSGETPLLLMLDGITDIRNIGGIARTAFCCGVHAIIIPDKGVGALNDDAILTSAGALEQIPVCRVNSLMKTVDDLHMNGIQVVATEMEASQTITEFDLRLPLAIVMGAEEKGIYPALMKVCDAQLRIPMAGVFESLNVSVATGMILYETMRQRGSGR